MKTVEVKNKAYYSLIRYEQNKCGILVNISSPSK